MKKISMIAALALGVAAGAPVYAQGIETGAAAAAGGAGAGGVAAGGILAGTGLTVAGATAVGVLTLTTVAVVVDGNSSGTTTK